MRCEELSSIMGIISNTRDLLREEREVWQAELDAMENRYQREVRGNNLSDEERERLERRMGEVQQLLKHYNRALFGMEETWSNLESGKMYLDKLSFNS